jgi:hypothetical protein
VLPGEIEHLCTDGTFSPQQKLSLDGLYRLNQRLANGEHISNIFDTGVFEPFLAHVFGVKLAPEPGAVVEIAND